MNWREMVGKYVVDSLGRRYHVKAFSEGPNVLLSVHEMLPEPPTQAVSALYGYSSRTVERMYQLPSDSQFLKDLRSEDFKP